MTNEPKILVVDDDPGFREILSVKLSSEGMQIETAENGLEAVEKAKSIKPDLILMDVKMPKMEGTEAALKLKADEDTKNIKIAFITQFGGADSDAKEVDEHFAVSAGAVGYIKKSEDLENIVAQVKSFLDK